MQMKIGYFVPNGYTQMSRHNETLFLSQLSLFKAGVSRLSKSMSAGHLGNEAETQKVMSQKCIENIYFRTLFLRHKKR